MFLNAMIIHVRFAKRNMHIDIESSFDPRIWNVIISFPDLWVRSTVIPLTPLKIGCEPSLNFYTIVIILGQYVRHATND